MIPYDFIFMQVKNGKSWVGAVAQWQSTCLAYKTLSSILHPRWQKVRYSVEDVYYMVKVKKIKKVLKRVGKGMWSGQTHGDFLGAEKVFLDMNSSYPEGHFSLLIKLH
jgi:hypothetical protein